MTLTDHRLWVPNREALDRLMVDGFPVGFVETSCDKSFHRDMYFDTADSDLQQHGVTCRLRMTLDDHRELTLVVDRGRRGAALSPIGQRFTATVSESTYRDVLLGTSEPARRLQAIVNPERLNVRLELETERFTRSVRRGWLLPRTYHVAYDRVAVHHDSHRFTFWEVKLSAGARGLSADLDRLARHLQDRHPVRDTLSTKLERAERRLATLAGSSPADPVVPGRELGLLAVRDGRLLVNPVGRGVAIPLTVGSGEGACRAVVEDVFGANVGRSRMLGVVPGTATRPTLEVWVLEALEDVAETLAPGAAWMPVDDIIAHVGFPQLRHEQTLAALALAAGTDVLRTSVNTLSGTTRVLDSVPASEGDADRYVNEQLSWLAFNERVLALAASDATPLLGRLLFLSIFGTNLDEFFMVRVGLLKAAIAEDSRSVSLDGLTAQQELHAILVRAATAVDWQREIFESMCRPKLAQQGVHFLSWEQLGAEARAKVTDTFHNQIFPLLTPHAMTQAPGHPFPHIENLRLALGITIRDGERGPRHFVHLGFPTGVPRFLMVGDTQVVAIEDVLRAHLGALYPGRTIEGAYVFRVTRSGEIDVDEDRAEDLVAAVEQKVRERPFGPVVRIEVDRRMPETMRELLLREISLEDRERHNLSYAPELVEVDDPVDLGTLNELLTLNRPDLAFEPFEGFAGLPDHPSMFEMIRERDLLVYHPYQPFDDTVQRFIVEAAEDPKVLAIKLTLYRSGSQSVIIDALMQAARAGKDVSVFVELKARFDEERNIHWARRLESAGIHVITGLVHLKTHAKTTLVVRRDDDGVCRYVHIGTGNYNAATAKQYTDLGLFSCRTELGADLNDLFNALTGTSSPPTHPFRKLLVSPNHHLEPLLQLIRNEMQHVEAGRGGRIIAKMNGLADREVIDALYDASSAGVQIDLIVRGLCSLRPGVPGLSDNIRVRSLVGRFLEHARIYHFGNGGDELFFIGSADWRSRNLRRRVEVVVPVEDEAARDRLREILNYELRDPTAWCMAPDGSYRQSGSSEDGPVAQAYFMDASRQARSGAAIQPL